jgi:hypothetical protein
MGVNPPMFEVSMGDLPKKENRHSHTASRRFHASD